MSTPGSTTFVAPVAEQVCKAKGAVRAGFVRKYPNVKVLGPPPLRLPTCEFVTKSGWVVKGKLHKAGVHVGEIEWQLMKPSTGAWLPSSTALAPPVADEVSKVKDVVRAYFAKKFPMLRKAPVAMVAQLHDWPGALDSDLLRRRPALELTTKSGWVVSGKLCVAGKRAGVVRWRFMWCFMRPGTAVWLPRGTSLGQGSVIAKEVNKAKDALRAHFARLQELHSGEDTSAPSAIVDVSSDDSEEEVE